MPTTPEYRCWHPGNGKTKTGRLWTYVRDDRPAGDEAAPAAWFAYLPDRGGERPEQHLRTFRCALQADAYAGFEKQHRRVGQRSKTGIPDCCLPKRTGGARARARRHFKVSEGTVEHNLGNIFGKLGVSTCQTLLNGIRQQDHAHRSGRVGGRRYFIEKTNLQAGTDPSKPPNVAKPSWERCESTALRNAKAPTFPPPDSQTQE